MRLFKIGLVALAFLLALLGEASAETRNIPANKTSTIGFYYTYVRNTCNYGSKPKFKLTQAPAHGSVTAKWQGYRMGQEAGYCAGKQVYGMMIVYTPNKGFQGKDAVAFDLIGSGVYPGMGYDLSRGFRIDVNVSASVRSTAAHPSRGAGKLALSRCQRHACEKS